MQRWFFATKELICTESKESLGEAISSGETLVKTPETTWRFCVTLDSDEKLLPNEVVAITGDYATLGQWSPEKCVIMKRESSESKVWTLSLRLPLNKVTKYRYLIAAVDNDNQKIMVRRWETHLKPRRVRPAEDKGKGDHQDIFGLLNGVTKVDRGWLIGESIVQFMFFKAPFTWKEDEFVKRICYVKVTPLRRKTNDDDAVDERPSTAFAFNEVAQLTRENSPLLHEQPACGTRCGPDDMLLFHLTLGDFKNTVYQLQLYSREANAGDDDVLAVVGYQFIRPSAFICSNGYINAPIMCSTTHRPLGRMLFRYSLIHPCKTVRPMDMSVSYTRYWNAERAPLDVGHRGEGKSFQMGPSVMYENTIRSFRTASQHGADMIEFDVQLTKDRVPIIFHDFVVRISIKHKKILFTEGGMPVPIASLSYKALMNLKMPFDGGYVRVGDVDSENRIFPTLADAMRAVPEYIAFNIEVKWSQQMLNGRWEENYHPCICRNLYIDSILESVFKHADQRRIVFSCFDADMCSLLRFKQNLYPAMFLIDSPLSMQYRDPRCSNVPGAAGFSSAMELLGLVVHSQIFLDNPSYLNFLGTYKGLIFFCYGGDELDKGAIQNFKSLGIKAVIFDRMGLRTNKKVLKSVFLIEAEKINLEELVSDWSLENVSKEDALKKFISRFEQSIAATT